MYDLSNAERAMLDDMAKVGHTVTEKGRDLLKRVLDLMPEPIEEPQEYPKMLYPAGVSHDEASERHLIGKPKGFVVHSKEEEDELNSKGPDEMNTMPSHAGEDPNARPGAPVEAISQRMQMERQYGVASDPYFDPANEPDRTRYSAADTGQQDHGAMYADQRSGNNRPEDQGTSPAPDHSDEHGGQPWGFPGSHSDEPMADRPAPMAGEHQPEPEHSDTDIDHSENAMLGGKFHPDVSETPHPETPMTPETNSVPGPSPTPVQGPIPQKSE